MSRLTMKRKKEIIDCLPKMEGEQIRESERIKQLEKQIENDK